MNKLIALLTASLIAASAAWADEWDINQNFVDVGAVDASWTIDPAKYEGTKTLINARYTLARNMVETVQPEDGCPPIAPAERLIGVLDGDFQFGDSDTGLEYVVVAATALAYQRNTELKAKKFMRVRETLEWGQLLYSRDDPLGVDYYVQLTAARGGLTWAYKRSENSQWTFLLGVKFSVGWAWASSFDPVYKNVDNVIIGSYQQAALVHEFWGRFYADGRVVDGTTIDSPPVNGSLTREAIIRSGYNKVFRSGLTVDIFAEKRSFNFSDTVIPSLYTKERRLGLEVGYQF